MYKDTGFTLVEVLIAMLLLAGGLLGMAALQATSLGNNQDAYNRSQATEFAYDIADRMRANSLGIATYTTIAPESAVENADCLITTGCSPADMAQTDLAQWNAMVSTLPLGQGTIAIAGGVYTITIIWDENHDGAVDANDHSFQTSFQL
ncbi:type IV pilus modification protein PilV [Methylovulum miyakonense]|uniref:type IV pilus modification protein PilV n=1 Tax=Methylovulum miyakonense TaxID=645578 RepID=UPI00035D6828|nr:type IV pilus modification protein PilV [Methylovulum miyakonense]